MLRKKGISPVIATVIIVAVAIAIAIAVAFWMTGIIGLFTRFEKVEVSYCYAEWDHDNDRWLIYLKARNTGSADATITNIFINGKPYTAIGGVTVHYATTSLTTWDGSDFPTTGIPLLSGKEVYFVIAIDKSSSGLEHGTSIEVKVITASGQEYPKMTNLP